MFKCTIVDVNKAGKSMRNKDASLLQLKLENQKAQSDMMNLMDGFQTISSTLALDDVLKKIMHLA